jgi:hypothetical protein
LGTDLLGLGIDPPRIAAKRNGSEVAGREPVLHTTGLGQLLPVIPYGQTSGPGTRDMREGRWKHFFLPLPPFPSPS